MALRGRTATASNTVEVDSIRHRNETRKNIPTEELRDFVAEEERTPATMLYPRDPSLDPQLVWKGKDEQDLQVPVVPIYIQEKIHPQALIDDLPRVKANPALAQLDMFSDFNGMDDDFDKKVEFDKHEQHWSNRLILGDSLLGMTSLAEKEGLKGKVQTLYIDPPYGITFGSNWQVSTRKKELRDGNAADATRQPEQVKAFRDTWANGIHSYLSYLRDRLVAARDLLTESGSVFVQIGDENVHLVRSVLDEVFGSQNFVVSLIVKKKSATTATDPVNDYIVWFAKNRESLKVRRLYRRRNAPEEESKYRALIAPDGQIKAASQLDSEEIQSLTLQGWNWARVDYPIVSQHPSATRSIDFFWNGQAYSCGRNSQWRFDPVVDLPRLGLAGRLFAGKNAKTLGGIMLWKDWPYVAQSNVWEDFHGEQDTVYVVQTNRRIVERCILMTTDPGDLVLDPTCGSGTTAYVAEQWGRRWITIDTSRVALALARTRLMAAKFPYYLLADTPEGVKRETELTGITPPPYPTEGDIRKGSSISGCRTSRSSQSRTTRISARG